MNIVNPEADGNCGFRALAKEVYGSQEEWKRVKDDLQDIYLKDTGLYQAIHGYDHSTIMDILTNRTEVKYYMIFDALLASLNLTTFTDRVVSLDIGFNASAVSLLLNDTFVPFASTVTILSLSSYQQVIAQKFGLHRPFVEGLVYTSFDIQLFYDPISTCVPKSQWFLKEAEYALTDVSSTLMQSRNAIKKSHMQYQGDQSAS